jgi:2-polyprenyl-3-methyl-5-hydroxy-6-metoxy-1,4-benzoquinol methylase
MTWDVRGTEINEDLVSIAKQNGFKVTHAADLSKFNDSTYDLIVAFDVLEHIPQEILPNMILEIKRIPRIMDFLLLDFLMVTLL